MATINDTQERQLIGLVADGLSNEEIARHIRRQRERGTPGWEPWGASITSHAVNKLLSALFAKLGVTSSLRHARAKAVAAAYEQGYITTTAMSAVVAVIVEHQRQAFEQKTDPLWVADEVREAIGPALFEQLAQALRTAQADGEKVQEVQHHG